MIVFKINKYLNERLSALACFMDVNMTADNLCTNATQWSLSRFDIMPKSQQKMMCDQNCAINKKYNINILQGIGKITI